MGSLVWKCVLSVMSAIALVASVPSLAVADESQSPEELQISSLAEELEVPKAEAEEILETQQQAPGIVEQLEEVQGRRYAGVWFDDESGKFVVPVLRSASRGPVESLIEDVELEPSEARVVSATYSWEELEEAQEEVDDALKNLIRSDLVQTGLNPVHNTVVVSVAEGADESAREAIRRTARAAGPAVSVDAESVPSFTAGPAACNSQYHCDKPLRGGVWIESDDTGRYCSAGFRAVGKALGNHFLLTAGHCGGNKKYWDAYNASGERLYLGEVQEDSYPGNDWGKIDVDYGYWAEPNWPASVVYWGGSQNLPITYESASYVGESVCHSGARTGSSCGVVTRIDETVSYEADGTIPGGTIYGLTEVQGWCSYKGDSGGPVWNGETALGLFSGMRRAEPCGEGIGWYSEITQADEAMGVTVGARVNVPPAVTTGEGDQVSPRPHEATVSGIVDPNGLATNYHFDFGTTTGYGSTSGETNISGGWQPQGASATLTGLTPATWYHYRLAASSGAGTGYGADQMFWTLPAPPTVEPSGTSGVSATSVMLEGYVGPENSETEWYFEYGSDSTYGTRMPEKVLPASPSRQKVSAVVTGLPVGAIIHYRLVAKNVAGISRSVDFHFSTGWLPSAVPNIASPSSESDLKDVSCLNRAACLAVGEDTSGKAISAIWDGSSWTAESLPGPNGAVVVEPVSVSCVNASTCEAFGSYMVNGWTDLPLAMRWEAGSWTAQSPVAPERVNVVFTAGACATASSCEAVGWTEESFQPERPLAERWNGTGWETQSMPLPAGATGGAVESISCTAANACVAVGVFAPSEGGRRAFAERWNGSAWTAETLPMPAGASKVSEISVSCWSASGCEAAGTFKDSSEQSVPFAQRWTGAAWQEESLPAVEGNPFGPTSGEVNDLACVSASSCQLVGRGIAPLNQARDRYLAEIWNGTKWVVTEPAEPTGWSAGRLEGVSCIGVSTCVGVGQISQVEGGVPLLASAETYFSLPPAAVMTKAASEVNATGASLHGTINPNGIAAETYFEYGPTSAYGSKTAVKGAGSGLTPVEQTAAISGLEPGSEYHFRIVGTNSGGSTYGKDATFRTPAPALGAMPITDPFNGTASPISNYTEQWTVLPWASGSSPKGEDRSNGWGPVAGFSHVAGASYGPTVVDLGTGTAVEATVQAPPTVAERYFSVWLDMPTSPTAKAGYQLEFTDTASSNYTVTLVKWSGGTSTQLGEATNVSLEGSASPPTVALVDEGATVSAWLDRGSGFMWLAGAPDSTYSNGTVAVEGSGNFTRLTNLRFGSLQAKVGGVSAALNGLRLDDAFATNESPLSEGGIWAALAWDHTSWVSTGQVVGGSAPGWSVHDALPNVNGAYWTKASFADTGSGDAVTATLRAKPLFSTEHFELLLDMPNPGSTRSGYELRLGECELLGRCKVRLEKYVAGTATLLGSTGYITPPTNGRFALVDKGGTLSVWSSTTSSGEYTQLLSAADSTFTGGYTGVAGAGTATHLQEFRAGPLAPY